MARIPMKLRYAILNRMNEVISQEPDGFCKYKDGFTDNMLAKEFNVTQAAIAGTRQEVFGKLRTWTPRPSDTPDLTAILARLDANDAKIQELQTKLDELNKRIDAMDNVAKLSNLGRVVSASKY